MRKVIDRDDHYLYFIRDPQDWEHSTDCTSEISLDRKQWVDSVFKQLAEVQDYLRKEYTKVSNKSPG